MNSLLKYRMKITLPPVKHFEEYSDEEKERLIDKYRELVTDDYFNVNNDNDDDDNDRIIINNNNKERHKQKKNKPEQPPPLLPHLSKPVYNSI